MMTVHRAGAGCRFLAWRRALFDANSNFIDYDGGYSRQA